MSDCREQMVTCEHPGGITSTRAFPSGAIECSGTDPDGYLVTITFYDYSRSEAVAAFRDVLPTYWRDLMEREQRRA